MAVMPGLEDESFDLVLADPPYGVDFQSGWTSKGKRHKKIENDKRPFVWWLPQAFRVLKPGGCLLCFCRWDVAEAFRLAIGWAGFSGMTQLIWDRVSPGMGDLTGRPSPRHDTIWFGAKGRFQFHGNRPASVYPVPRVTGVLKHPNQKPLPLLKQMVRDYCPEGGRVLDPTAGCGSTVVAAVMCGRVGVGVELNENYATRADREVQAARPGRNITMKPLV
jgi:site-specific DNA-methyltransferase (adenine-specific)